MINKIEESAAMIDTDEITLSDKLDEYDKKYREKIFKNKQKTNQKLAQREQEKKMKQEIGKFTKKKGFMSQATDLGLSDDS